MPAELRDIPVSVRDLIKEFRDGLLETLNGNLVGAYLHGSIAFPEFEPTAGDIDFYIVVQRSLNENERNKLDKLHQTLARKFEHGKRLDGFYIPLVKARKQESPPDLAYGARGKLRVGGHDDAWAIHREHFHRSTYITLHGPLAGEIFPSTSWPEIRSELYLQLNSAKRRIRKYPGYAVLSLCRLIYDFENRNIAISKIGAAQWALKKLPPEWRPLVRSAISAYRGKADETDSALLKKKADAFLAFATDRITAHDLHHSLKSTIACLRKTANKKRKER